MNLPVIPTIILLAHKLGIVIMAGVCDSELSKMIKYTGADWKPLHNTPLIKIAFFLLDLV